MEPGKDLLGCSLPGCLQVCSGGGTRGHPHHPNHRRIHPGDRHAAGDVDEAVGSGVAAESLVAWLVPPHRLRGPVQQGGRHGGFTPLRVEGHGQGVGVAPRTHGSSHHSAKTRVDGRMEGAGVTLEEKLRVVWNFSGGGFGGQPLDGDDQAKLPLECCWRKEQRHFLVDLDGVPTFKG